jgi:hypothetical protein
MQSKKYLPRSMKKELKEGNSLPSSLGSPEVSLPYPPFLTTPNATPNPPSLARSGDELRGENSPVPRQPEATELPSLVRPPPASGEPTSGSCRTRAEGVPPPATHPTEGEQSSPDPLQETESPSVPAPDSLAKETTEPSGSEIATALVAHMVGKLAKAKGHPYYHGLETKKTLLSRYRKIELQRAFLRGDLAFPKKRKKKKGGQ